MRFNTNPRAFPTKHWRTLYESCIPDLESLRKSTAGAVIAVIDAEPWGADDSKPAEIGISLLPAPNELTINALPKTLDAISHTLKVETHWIRVLGRDRREKNRENHCFGLQHFVEGGEVEQSVSDIIETFLLNHSNGSHQGRPGSTSPLILTGFGLVFEFRILSTLYPRILDHFTYWLDIQELAREVASDEASGLTSPSLRETLIACGFEDDTRNSQSMKSSQHNAAADTVRGVAVLIQFLGLAKGTRLDIRKSSRRTNHVRNHRRIPTTPNQKRLWTGARPTPKEFFPYTARISRAIGFNDIQPQAILDIFANYEPTAVGICKGNRYGWVCLPDIQTLEAFVQRVNDTILDDGNVWTAVSDYDPTVVPAQTWEELKSNQRLEAQAKADEKREQRRLKREIQDAEAKAL